MFQNVIEELNFEKVTNALDNQQIVLNVPIGGLQWDIFNILATFLQTFGKVIISGECNPPYDNFVNVMYKNRHWNSYAISLKTFIGKYKPVTMRSSSGNSVINLIFTLK